MKEIYVVHHLDGGDKKSIAFVDFDLCESYTSTLKNGTYHMQKIALCESVKELSEITANPNDKMKQSSFFPKGIGSHLVGAVHGCSGSNIREVMTEKYGQKDHHTVMGDD